MSNLLRLALSLLMTLTLVAFLGCEGDEGPQGPPGGPGDRGNDGQNYDALPPSDPYFGLRLAHRTDAAPSGATLGQLTFDSAATPSDEKLVGYKLSQPPIIDGQLSEGEEWLEAEVPNTIALGHLLGADNRIRFADMLFGYDDKYIYMFIGWNEISDAPFNDIADWAPDRWSYDATATVRWTMQGSYEDMLYLFWGISGVDEWATEGSAVLYHGEDPELYLDTEGRVDAWVWRAGRTGLISFVDDMYFDFSKNNGRLIGDQGAAAFEFNETNGLPRWMHRLDPNASFSELTAPQYPPLRIYDAVVFVQNPTGGWDDGATIQGWTVALPTGSRSDIECSRSDLPRTQLDYSWVVELRRLRNTGHGDDYQFVN